MHDYGDDPAMFKFSLLLIISFLSLLFSSCGGGVGKVSFREAPKFINVSAYDPKERQRGGRSYSPLNQAALKANGSLALIARCSKGYVLDTKCADFLVGAEKQGMELGAYFYVQPWISATKQADFFISRLRTIKKSRGLKSRQILLVGDIDTNCNGAQIAAFIQRIEALTGTTPVIYLENSKGLRDRLSNTSSHYKKIIRRAPYWLALYSNKEIATPRKLTKEYGIWNKWAMWQYGGVFWENGRSDPKVYHAANWRAPEYFGNLNRPIERNAFNGTREEFYAFWNRYSWKW